jgi:hypothetical protein
MQNKKISIASIVVALAFPSVAFAYRANHKGMTELRPVLGGDAYVSQQVQYSESQGVMEGKAPQNAMLQGYSLRAGIGLEHNRLVQTGGYFASVTENLRGGKNAEFRTFEVGAEAKLVFSGPLANLCIGGGYNASQGSYRNGLELSSVSGTGYFGVAEVVYFLSSRMSMNVSASKTWSNMFIRSENFSRIKTEGLRGGAGFSIWL